MVLEYLKLFVTFAKIGMFTIGGGYAMIPLIEREIVAKQWMSKEEFMEMFALTQSLPGVFAVNISIFVGYKLSKVGGSLVCALATILPSFVIMMLIAMFFARFQDNEVMIRIFNGIRPAVVALILFPCISAVRALKLKYLQLVAPAIATLLIWQFGLSPIYIVLAGILGGLVYTLWLKEKIYLQLLWVYLKIGMFGFGGGYAMLSLIQHEIVDIHHWLTPQQFTDVVAISQMTPGPIGINSATYVGYAVTQSVWGAVLATVAVCLPSFILVLLISYFFAKCKDNKYIKAAMSGLLPMSVALIASAALLMMNRENFMDYKSIGIFAAAFLVTWKWNLHPILLICLAGVVGLLLY